MQSLLGLSKCSLEVSQLVENWQERAKILGFWILEYTQVNMKIVKCNSIIDELNGYLTRPKPYTTNSYNTVALVGLHFLSVLICVVGRNLALVRITFRTLPI